MAILENQIVVIDYKVRVNGDIIDSSAPGEPLVFLSGTGKILPTLEAGISEMRVGEQQKISVLAKDAYGEYYEDAKDEVPLEQFDGIDLELGTPVQGQDAEGRMIQATVIGLKENTVVIDFNHPLAGHDMEFDVTLLEVREATEAEIANEGPLEL